MFSFFFLKQSQSELWLPKLAIAQLLAAPASLSLLLFTSEKQSDWYVTRKELHVWQAVGYDVMYRGNLNTFVTGQSYYTHNYITLMESHFEIKKSKYIHAAFQRFNFRIRKLIPRA